MNTLYQRLVAFSSDPQITPSQIGTVPLDSLQLDDECAKFMDQYKVYGMIRDTEGYHWRVATCHPQPYILYYQGDLSVLDGKTISIVGPRIPSHYAIDTVKELLSLLKGRSAVTVSGGAKGIDSIVHQYSLELGIPTVVVLGGGLQYYQRHHLRQLINQVVKSGGLVLSQRKLQMEPTRYSFPQRNILIAGLGDILFVPSAGRKSGSLLTVDFALDMNRVVYTVPTSNSDPNGKGTNQYIAQQKVRVVTDMRNFVTDLWEGRDLVKKKYAPQILTIEQKNLLQTMQQEVTFNELLAQTHLDGHTLLAQLSELESYELIKETSSGRYISC